MLKTYLTIAWRNISRNKIYTVINVLGLALGICACIVIYLITAYDFSFDSFHPNKDRIYRIVGELQRPTGEKMFFNSPTEDVAGFETQIPGFEAAAAFHEFGEGVSIPNGNQAPKKFGGRQQGDSWGPTIIITGPQWLNIFHYQFLAGNPKTALSNPFSTVLTEKRAQLYFGNIPLASMLGKTVVYQDSLRTTVTGIVKDWEGNTNFGFTDFISLSTATHSFLKANIPTESWSSLSPHRSMAFVKLQQGTTPEQINARFAHYVKQHVKLPNPGSSLTMTLQPLSDIHFTNEYHREDDGDSFRKAYLPVIYVLMGLAGFILLIAAVNFINLSTAQSVQRAKEIGVRKVLGSTKIKIVYQFLTETGVLTLIAVLVSIILVKPVLAAFSTFIPTGVDFHLSQPSTWGFLAAVTIITALLAGFYPAKVLASYLPALSLKGSAQQTSHKINPRKALIVFQFSVSLLFIMGVLVMQKQIRFMTTSDKGFNTDAVISMYNWNDHEGKLKVFAENCKQLPGVAKAIIQGVPPIGQAQMIANFKIKEKEENSRQIQIEIGDHNFIPFYGMKIIAGRNVLESDTLNELVINETLAHSLGFENPGDALGKLLYHSSRQGDRPYPIVGVVADFYTGSFHAAIPPIVFENLPERMTGVAIKLAAGEKNPAQVKSVLSKIEAEWKKIFPETPFEYQLLNESISWLYEPERKTLWLTNIAMALTIFISCMGLFGLGMYTAQRRKKEIGIRKVLGATVSNIATMMGKEFVRLVLIAIVIATPLSWWVMNQWLQDFAYRTDISWWIYLLAGGIAVIVAVITVSYQSIKAAMANPVASLRSE